MENLPDDALSKSLNDSATELNAHVQTEIEKKKRGPKGPRGSKKITSLESQAVAVKMSKDQYANALGGVFVISGMFLTKFTGFEGFALDEEEIKMLAVQGAEVADLCMPSIDPKTMAIAGFSFSLLGVYGMKYLAFREHLIENQKKGNAVTPVAEVSPENKPAEKKKVK